MPFNKETKPNHHLPSLFPPFLYHILSLSSLISSLCHTLFSITPCSCSFFMFFSSAPFFLVFSFSLSVSHFSLFLLVVSFSSFLPLVSLFSHLLSLVFFNLFPLAVSLFLSLLSLFLYLPRFTFFFLSPSSLFHTLSSYLLLPIVFLFVRLFFLSALVSCLAIFSSFLYQVMFCLNVIHSRLNFSFLFLVSISLFIPLFSS